MAGKKEKGLAAALFDVEGTLVDTNYLHAVTWWEAFRQAGYQVSMAEIHRAIGMGSGRHELVSAGAAEVYRDPADLLAALPASLLGRSG